MLIIFASMLYERRIIITSKRLSRLSSCIQAANLLIYPMHWQHIFIPILPKALTDYLTAPMPFLIGVPTKIMESKVDQRDLGEVVILDADNSVIKSPFTDLESLPFEVTNNLKRNLRDHRNLLGDSVARAFLQALVQLIGGYREALKFPKGEKISFNEEAFIESRPPSMQPFLHEMLQLQIFQQFLEERLQMLNTGTGYSDEFELEAIRYQEKYGSSASSSSNNKLRAHAANVGSAVKREGGAMIKAVKSKVCVRKS